MTGQSRKNVKYRVVFKKRGFGCLIVSVYYPWDVKLDF